MIKIFRLSYKEGLSIVEVAVSMIVTVTVMMGLASLVNLSGIVGNKTAIAGSESAQAARYASDFIVRKVQYEIGNSATISVTASKITWTVSGATNSIELTSDGIIRYNSQPVAGDLENGRHNIIFTSSTQKPLFKSITGVNGVEINVTAADIGSGTTTSSSVVNSYTIRTAAVPMQQYFAK